MGYMNTRLTSRSAGCSSTGMHAWAARHCICGGVSIKLYVQQCQCPSATDYSLHEMCCWLPACQLCIILAWPPLSSPIKLPAMHHTSRPDCRHASRLMIRYAGTDASSFTHHLGTNNGCSMSATVYAMTARTAAQRASSSGSILSGVSATE
jgi:hypothetical protein